jgi:hypothetical protein
MKCSPQNVTKHLRKGTLLKGIYKAEKIGRIYLLVVKHDFLIVGESVS